MMRVMIRPDKAWSCAADWLWASSNSGTPAPLRRGAIEHQTMRMEVQVGRRAQALDQGERTAVGLAAFESRLLPILQRAGSPPGWCGMVGTL